MIGSAREINGLYYFEGENLSERQAQVANQSSTKQNLLWYFRLGHLNLSYFERLFSKIVQKQVSKLQCVLWTFQTSKGSILPQPYEKHVPFVLVHSDIWGP